METFEPGIQSAYSTHQFKAGEQGMKCRSCPRVMTLAEWQEKRKCFCQSPNAVRAVACSSAPTRLQPRNNSSNHQNTRVNISASTVTPPSVFSRYSSPSNSRDRSFSLRWIKLVIITFVLGGVFWQIKSNNWLFFSKNSERNSISHSNQNSLSQLTAKEAITQYYKLAPSNRTSALDLLSDEYKKLHKQNDGGNSAKSFWNTIQEVEIYAFLTLRRSENKYKIKVWLKYFTVDGYTACESQIIEVVLDERKNKWLINKTSNIEQKFNCEQ